MQGSNFPWANCNKALSDVTLCMGKLTRRIRLCALYGTVLDLKRLSRNANCHELNLQPPYFLLFIYCTIEFVTIFFKGLGAFGINVHWKTKDMITFNLISMP